MRNSQHSQERQGRCSPAPAGRTEAASTQHSRRPATQQQEPPPAPAPEQLAQNLRSL